MQKKITRRWLKQKSACLEGINFVEMLNDKETFVVIETLRKHRFDWCNWLIVRLMTKEQKIKYAIFTAKLVLHIYEKKYPDDKRPAKAIQAAEKYLKDNTADAADAAYAAAYAAADAAAAAAYAAAAAAYAAAAAAYAAAAAAYAAATYAAAYAAADADAAATATYADAADDDDVKSKIINFGIKLLKEEVNG